MELIYHTSCYSTRVPYQLERIVTVMIRFWLLWFIFHVTFGFTLVLLWFCDLLRPIGTKKDASVLVWFWFYDTLFNLVSNQAQNALIQYFGTVYFFFGFRVVLSKKRTFCNRACVQIALKPLGLGLVLWFYDVVWCFVIYSIPENIIKSYLIFRIFFNYTSKN